MSVVPMKMLTVAGPADSIDPVICTCLVNEQFNPVEAARVANNDHLVPFEWTNPWQEPLATAEKLLSDMNIPLAFQDFRDESLSMSAVKKYFGETEATLSRFREQSIALQDRISDNTQDVTDLEKFLQLPSSLEDIYHLNYVRFRFGRMPRESYDSLAIKVEKMDEIILYPTQMGKDFVYLA